MVPILQFAHDGRMSNSLGLNDLMPDRIYFSMIPHYNLNRSSGSQEKM